MQRQSQTLPLIMRPQAVPVSTTMRRQTFGEYLKRERVMRGISKDELFLSTRVRERYISALEENRYEELPPKTFVLGFLKCISKHLGLNESDVLNRYLQDLESQESEKKLQMSLMPSPTLEPKRKWWMFFAGIGFVVLMILPHFLRSA